MSSKKKASEDTEEFMSVLNQTLNENRRIAIALLLPVELRAHFRFRLGADASEMRSIQEVAELLLVKIEDALQVEKRLVEAVSGIFREYPTLDDMLEEIPNRDLAMYFVNSKRPDQ